MFLTQRQFLPNRSRRRVGKWSRGLEKIFETVIRDGIRKGEFRGDLDPRLTTLAILGLANAVAGWYGKENASIARVSFVAGDRSERGRGLGARCSKVGRAVGAPVSGWRRA